MSEEDLELPTSMSSNMESNKQCGLCTVMAYVAGGLFLLIIALCSIVYLTRLSDTFYKAYTLLTIIAKGVEIMAEFASKHNNTLF